MFKKTLLLIAVLSSWSNNLIANQTEYLFEAISHESDKGIVEFIYTNTSNDPHCIRAEDFPIVQSLFSDSFYVTETNGKPIRYFGLKSKTFIFLSFEPRSFIVVLPKDKVSSTLSVKNFYAVKNKDFSISYSIPVVPCSVLMVKKFAIPPVSYMKHKINDPDVEKTSIYENDYHDWAAHGFVAVSKKLLVKKTRK